MVHNRESSESATTVIFILILGGMLLLGAAGVGLLFWMSMSRRAEALAAVQRERAIAEMRRAEAVTRSQLDQQHQAKMQSTATADGQLVALDLNEIGETYLDGEEISLAQVQHLLQTSKADSIQLTVHPKCAFEHVVELRAACLASGVEKLRIMGFDE